MMIDNFAGNVLLVLAFTLPTLAIQHQLNVDVRRVDAAMITAIISTLSMAILTMRMDSFYQVILLERPLDLLTKLTQVRLFTLLVICCNTLVYISLLPFIARQICTLLDTLRDIWSAMTPSDKHDNLLAWDVQEEPVRQQPVSSHLIKFVVSLVGLITGGGALVMSIAWLSWPMQVKLATDQANNNAQTSEQAAKKNASADLQRHAYSIGTKSLALAHAIDVGKEACGNKACRDEKNAQRNDLNRTLLPYGLTAKAKIAEYGRALTNQALIDVLDDQLTMLQSKIAPSEALPHITAPPKAVPQSTVAAAAADADNSPAKLGDKMTALASSPSLIVGTLATDTSTSLAIAGEMLAYLLTLILAVKDVGRHSDDQQG